MLDYHCGSYGVNKCSIAIAGLTVQNSMHIEVTNTVLYFHLKQFYKLMSSIVHSNNESYPVYNCCHLPVAMFISGRQKLLRPMLIMLATRRSVYIHESVNASVGDV